MRKRYKLITISIIIIILIFLVFQTVLSKEGDQSLLDTIFTKSILGKGNKGASGGGGSAGGTVPIITTELKNKGKDYDIKPSRLKFEFNDEPYALQLRRIKKDVEEDYAEFLVMKLDKNNLEDITAYTIDHSFNLVPSKIIPNGKDKMEIDLDKDGVKDLYIKLKSINKKKYESAQFFIKKIK